MVSVTYVLEVGDDHERRLARSVGLAVGLVGMVTGYSWAGWAG